MADDTLYLFDTGDAIDQRVMVEELIEERDTARAELAEAQEHRLWSAGVLLRSDNDRLQAEADGLRADVRIAEDKLAEVVELLQELAELVDDPDYTQDSFTTQPARVYLDEREVSDAG